MIVSLGFVGSHEGQGKSLTFGMTCLEWCKDMTKEMRGGKTYKDQ